ncbi:hypothetical protein P3T76_016434 [Phytophthora citrophthora]|uniref:Uncharacterized protein n=1 Tax=Phytophthora citrophthora TaxID=4793 RepID=A0AAD9L9G5_9STRA|nr:hypothetical protein P3T76_016434 [Phytophthora citrophthora]
MQRLVEDAGETCLVARSGDEVYPPVTRVTRVQFPDGKLLFAPTCSHLLFCSSALLLFCFAFLCCSLSCRSRTTTDISHATNAQLAHRHLCCCRIGLTNADEDRHVHGAVLVIGRGCGRNVFGGAEWRRGLVEDAGETCLVARSGDEGMVERVWSLVEDAGETCLVARSGDEDWSRMREKVARSGDEGMVERVWSWRIGTSAAVESDSPTRTKIRCYARLVEDAGDTCTAPYSSLVEDAGETCLVARSGDEGMVERVWSLVEDAGETCLVARSGDEGMVERVWSLVEDAGETCLVARSGDEGFSLV